MFECDCTQGYELNLDGYSCKPNNISSYYPLLNESRFEDYRTSDVFYQKGVSFSAKLEDMKSENNNEINNEDNQRLATCLLFKYLVSIVLYFSFLYFYKSKCKCGLHAKSWKKYTSNYRHSSKSSSAEFIGEHSEVLPNFLACFPTLQRSKLGHRNKFRVSTWTVQRNFTVKRRKRWLEWGFHDRLVDQWFSWIGVWLWIGKRYFSSNSLPSVTFDSLLST